MLMVDEPSGERSLVPAGGLTKREYFAAQAMKVTFNSYTDLGVSAEWAVRVADAMLAALAARPEGDER
jgi:hypothetical protein